MKLDCQQVLTQFASFSVEELSDAEANSLLHHLDECEPCKGQWLLFEKTLTVTTQSGPRDEDIEQYRSQQMWLVCLEHARQKGKHSSSDYARPARVEIESGAPINAHSTRPEPLQARAVATGATAVTPRLGLMMIGGALLMLASSYWLAPRPSAPVSTDLPPMPAQMKTVGFEPLPSRAATLVDYGATLGFDALSDHVEPTLVSSQPQPKRANSASSTFKDR